MNHVNLKGFVENYKSSHQFEIDEKISVFKLIIKPASSNSAKSLFEDLLKELDKIPSRDTFRLEIQDGVDSGREFRVNTREVFEEILNSYESTKKLGGSFELLLEIKKKYANGFLSVYFIEELDKYFSQRHTINIIKELSAYIADGLHFVVFSPLKRCGSKTIYFSSPPPEGAPIYIDRIKRLKAINIFKDSSSFLGYEEFSSKLLPSDFYADGNIDFPNIKYFFDKAFVILSFAFLSNQSEVQKKADNNYRLTVKIHGYKALDFDAFSCKQQQICLLTLFKIYEWVYQSDSGNPVEKIGLVRNLISLHTSEKDEVVIDDILWQAIKSNYKVYLKENVEVYLEAKSKIAEVLTASVEKTQELVEGVVGSIRAAIGVLVTFLLTVVLINGFKEIGEVEKIFSTSYLFIVFIISFFTWIWICFSIKDAKNRFLYSSENIENIILTSYKNILLPSEIKEATSQVREKNIKYIEEYTDRYKKYWEYFLLFFFGVYFLGYLFYSESSFIKEWMESLYSFLFGATAV